MLGTVFLLRFAVQLAWEADSHHFQVGEVESQST